MMGQRDFAGIFGAAPVDEQAAEQITANIARDAVRAGYAVVIDRPGTKVPMCPLTAAELNTAEREAQQAGRRRHECGLKHAMTDPELVYRRVRRLGKRLGPVNLGLELGASRMVVVDVDTVAELEGFRASWEAEAGGAPFPSMTVSSPGALDQGGRMVHKDGGHYWFTLPVGVELPEGSGVLKHESGWVAMWARHQVLVPPSQRPEGSYKLLSAPTECPAWLLTTIQMAVEARRVRVDRRLDMVHDSDDPLEQWSAITSWAELLEGDGWTETGLVDTCSCPIWTAPGEHASPKSATAHDVGCELYDVSTGWGPLYVWTDNPPDWMAGRGKTFTKVNYISARDYAGDHQAALVGLGINGPKIPVPGVEDFVVEGGQEGSDAPNATEGQGETSDPFDCAGTPVPADGSGAAPGAGSGPEDGRPAASGTGRTSAAGPRKSARPGQGPQPGKRQVKATPASAIPMRATRWLWLQEGGHWVPVGGLTLLGGREGIGKSTIAYLLSAMITQGVLPGAFEGRPRSVIVAATEDDWAATIVPRLVAAGADLDRVYRVDVLTEQGHMGPLSLPEDVESIKGLARQVDAVLVLLDPLLTVVNKKLDSHKDAEVRQALEPLSRLLSEAGLAGIGLIHVNKSQGNDLLTRLMASRAFSAVARAVLFAARDDEVPEAGLAQAEPDGRDRFMLGQPKNNLAARVGYTLGYHIEGAMVGYDDELHEPITSSKVIWSGRREQGIDDVVGDQEKKRRGSDIDKPIDRAVKWLTEYLKQAGGPVPSAKVREDGLMEGHAEATIKRASRMVGVHITVIPGTHNATSWSLTDPTDLTDLTDLSDPTDPTDESDQLDQSDHLSPREPTHD